MNKIVYALLIIFLGVVGCATTDEGDIAQEPATTQPQGSPSDVEIESSIRAALQQDDLLTNTNIQVDSRNGVVVLSGQVPSGRAMNRAVSLARSVPGVRRLDVQQLKLP